MLDPDPQPGKKGKKSLKYVLLQYVYFCPRRTIIAFQQFSILIIEKSKTISHIFLQILSTIIWKMIQTFTEEKA
jgi:hypothetical protein